MNKTHTTILLMGLMFISLAPMVFGDNLTIDLMIEGIADLHSQIIVNFGSVPLNDVRVEEVFHVGNPAINSTVNITLLYRSGISTVNYRLIAPAGSKDGWASGKTIQLNTKYSIPIDKVGSYYVEAIPITGGLRNTSMYLEYPYYLNITRS